MYAEGFGGNRLWTVDLFLLGHTCINKNYTRPYKLSRVRHDRTVLRQREPYQEWQWPPLSRLLPQALCLLPQGLPEAPCWTCRASAIAVCLVQDSRRLRGSSVCIWQKKISCVPTVLMLWDPQSPSASSRLSHSPGLFLELLCQFPSAGKSRRRALPQARAH